jgi:uncharacterized membrane protein
VKRVSERTLHLTFVVALWAKAALAASEIVGGVAAWLVSKQFLLREVVAVTRGELAEDPHDAVANYLLHSAQHLSVGAKTFAAIYLLAHGVIKLWLVIGLLRERLWYYPIAIAVFVGFIAYQVYRYALHHSALLLVITALDVVVIALTWHEWRYLGRRLADGPRHA